MAIEDRQSTVRTSGCNVTATVWTQRQAQLSECMTCGADLSTPKTVWTRTHMTDTPYLGIHGDRYEATLGPMLPSSWTSCTPGEERGVRCGLMLNGTGDAPTPARLRVHDLRRRPW